MFWQHGRHALEAWRQASGCLAAGQGVKGFFVQVGRFKQERQGSFKGLRNVLHHL